MNPSRKKNGEKAVLLQACGEELFRCEGENKVTQGIYVIRKGRKLECFCKRAVWVPIDPASLETLKSRFKSFNAPWPSMLDESPMVGLCGRNATRTAHATDSTFLVLALHQKMKFVAVGIVRVEYGPFIGDVKPDIHVTGISSDATELDDCIEWIRKESSIHESTKKGVVKRPRTKTIEERILTSGVVSEMKRARMSSLGVSRLAIPPPTPVPVPVPVTMPVPAVGKTFFLGSGAETSSDIMPTTPMFSDDAYFIGSHQPQLFHSEHLSLPVDLAFSTFVPPAPIVCDPSTAFAQVLPSLSASADIVTIPSKAQDSPTTSHESDCVSSPEHVSADPYAFIESDAFPALSVFPDFSFGRCFLSTGLMCINPLFPLLLLLSIIFFLV